MATTLAVPLCLTSTVTLRALLGFRASWLPRILGWVLPNVDIEGGWLSRHVPISAADLRATVSRGTVR